VYTVHLAWRLKYKVQVKVLWRPGLEGNSRPTSTEADYISRSGQSSRCCSTRLAELNSLDARNDDARERWSRMAISAEQINGQEDKTPAPRITSAPTPRMHSICFCHFSPKLQKQWFDILWLQHITLNISVSCVSPSANVQHGVSVIRNTKSVIFQTRETLSINTNQSPWKKHVASLMNNQDIPEEN